MNGNHIWGVFRLSAFNPIPNSSAAGIKDTFATSFPFFASIVMTRRQIMIIFRRLGKGSKTPVTEICPLYLERGGRSKKSQKPDIAKIGLLIYKGEGRLLCFLFWVKKEEKEKKEEEKGMYTV